jgi:hypothetical protein
MRCQKLNLLCKSCEKKIQFTNPISNYELSWIFTENELYLNIMEMERERFISNNG